MTIKVTFNGASNSKPGVYPAVKVLNLTGFPLAPTGIVGILGEATGGKDGVLDVLEGPQIQQAKARYKSGPIADALGLLAAPSKDGRIANGASKIIVFKTNAGTQSTLALNNTAASPVPLVNLTSKNWGADENGISAQVTAGSVLDANATIAGTVTGPYTMAVGLTLLVKVDGVVYTYTSSITGSQTAAAVVTDLNTGGNWSPSKPVVASLVASKPAITVDSTALPTAALDYGYLSIDPASTADTVLGIVGTARGTRGTRFVILKKGATIENKLPEIGGHPVLTVRYTGSGTLCALSIQDSLGQRLLTTAVTGAPSDNLSLVLGDTTDGVLSAKLTIQQLVDLINSHAGYTATTVYSNPSAGATILDYYSGLTIEVVAADLKADVQDFVDTVTAVSSLASAARISEITGQVAIAGPAFFAGATDGSSVNSDWSNGLEGFKQIRVEQIVPLISTDKGSLSVDTVNALCDSHAQYAWSANGRSPRQIMASKLGSKAQVKTAAGSLNSGYTSLVAQDVQVYSQSQGKLAFLDPWAAACIAAGLRAGSEVGEPNTFKIVNINDLRTRDGSWHPKVDYTEMIDAGVTIFEPMDAGGFRIVLDNTTYSADASFVYNRGAVVEAVGFLYYDLMINLEILYTGTKGRSGSAAALAATIAGRMDEYLKAEIIVGDDLNKGKGFKDLRVVLNGNAASIDITVTPVQGIDFILPTIYLADIKQSA